jgi:DNA-binding NarL/FixJ family response regulator
MDEEEPRKATPFGRSARNRRIVERLREGFGFHEIAREEKLSDRRVRQIVKQALDAGLRSRTSTPSAPGGHGRADAPRESRFTGPELR